MEKQKITGSEALLKALIAEGVDTIFGYPGGQALPMRLKAMLVYPAR